MSRAVMIYKLTLIPWLLYFLFVAMVNLAHPEKLRKEKILTGTV